MEATETKIKVMQHFLNGGNIEYYSEIKDAWVLVEGVPFWDWHNCEYRIQEQNKSIILEKWLCSTTDEFDNIEYWTCESSNIDSYIKHINCEKVKLLDKYEVEL